MTNLMPEIEEKSVGFWAFEVIFFLGFLAALAYFSKTKTIKKLGNECVFFSITPLVLFFFGGGLGAFISCFGFLFFILFINLFETLDTVQKKILGSALPALLFLLSLKFLDPHHNQLDFWERYWIMMGVVMITSSFFITQILIRMRREKEGMKKELEKRMTGGGVVRG